MEDKVKRAYREQAWAAKCRGIEFQLTLDEWTNWWEDQLGSDWMKKRGCRKGQYVMARPGDLGPYALGNIECILAEENHRNYNLARTPPKGWNCPRLPKEVVVAVFLDEAPYAEIARKHEKYKMTTGRIQSIKLGQHYGKYTREILDYSG